jgi:hypothetical protein
VARQVLFREDSTVDELIDVIEGNRKYIRCLYVYNKIDVMGMDDVDRLARQPNSVVISCSMNVSHAPPLCQADAKYRLDLGPPSSRPAGFPTELSVLNPISFAFFASHHQIRSLLIPRPFSFYYCCFRVS